MDSDDELTLPGAVVAVLRFLRPLKCHYIHCTYLHTYLVN